MNQPAGFGNDSPMGDARSDAEIIARGVPGSRSCSASCSTATSRRSRYLLDVWWAAMGGRRAVGPRISGSHSNSGPRFQPLARERTTMALRAGDEPLCRSAGAAKGATVGAPSSGLRGAGALWTTPTPSTGADDRLLRAGRPSRPKCSTRRRHVLPPGKTRTSFLLVAWEELTYEEVAAAFVHSAGEQSVEAESCAAGHCANHWPEIGNEPVTVNCEPGGGVRDDG